MALCQAPKVSRINRTAPKTAWPMCCIFCSNDSYPLLSCASHHACRFQKIMLKNIFSLKFTNIIVWLADALSSNSLANFEKLVMSWAIHGFFMLWIENHILSFKFWYKSKFFRVKKSSLKRYRKCIRRFKHWFTQEYTLLVKLQEDSYFATKISFRFTAFCTKKSELSYDCVVVINAKKKHFDRHFQTSFIFIWTKKTQLECHSCILTWRPNLSQKIRLYIKMDLRINNT